MGFILRFLIRVYQIALPNSMKGRGCLFSESCSNHVYRITKEQGLVEGLRSLRKRLKECRSGYHILQIEDDIILRTKNGKVIHQEEINPKILKEQLPLVVES